METGFLCSENLASFPKCYTNAVSEKLSTAKMKDSIQEVPPPVVDPAVAVHQEMSARYKEIKDSVFQQM